MCKIIAKWKKRIKYKLAEKKAVKSSVLLKRKLSSCGEGLQLYGNPEISFPNKLEIGNNCKINSDVYINARSSVTIGDDVTLSHGVKIISTGYDIEHWMKTGQKKHIDDSPVYIGNHCWIGANAIVLPGVKITGEYVVIGAGSVVTKNITESKAIFAGVPAKMIKKFY